MFTPTLRCECAQPGLIDTMRKWSIHPSMRHCTGIGRTSHNKYIDQQSHQSNLPITGHLCQIPDTYAKYRTLQCQLPDTP